MSSNPFFSILSASNQSQGKNNQNVSSQQQNNNMILRFSYATIDRQHELLERQRTRDFLQQMMMMNNHKRYYALSYCRCVRNQFVIFDSCF